MMEFLRQAQNLWLLEAQALDKAKMNPRPINVDDPQRKIKVLAIYLECTHLRSS